MKLPVLIDGNPLLRTISQEVIEITPKIQTLIRDMSETMIAENGIGLAAPQVGENVRVITVLTKDGVKAYINPRITKKSFLREKGEEGCLSVPGVYDMVKRCRSITVSTLDETGRTITFSAKGFFARVIQHEIDHLNGILFTDYVK